MVAERRALRNFRRESDVLSGHGPSLPFDYDLAGGSDVFIPSSVTADGNAR